jgi:uncharacterized protein
MNTKLVISIPTILFLLLAIYLFPWQKINWGTIRVGPERTITVTGSAETTEINEVARFTAGVTEKNVSKEIAVTEVETKMQAISQAVKEFGIADKDIQTESVSVYKAEDYALGGLGTASTTAEEWRASTNISIVLRDIDRATELTSLLTNLETTNVYGPNFSMEDTKDQKTDLLEAAVKDAQVKAEKIAKAQKVKVGKIISINEGTQGSPMPIRFAAESKSGGGMPMEPGSSTIHETVTVTFAVK